MAAISEKILMTILDFDKSEGWNHNNNIIFEFLDSIHKYNHTTIDVLGDLEVAIWLVNLF